MFSVNRLMTFALWNPHMISGWAHCWPHFDLFKVPNWLPSVSPNIHCNHWVTAVAKLIWLHVPAAAPAPETHVQWNSSAENCCFVFQRPWVKYPCLLIKRGKWVNHAHGWLSNGMYAYVVGERETVLHVFNCIIDPRKRNLTSDMHWLLNVVPICSAWSVKSFKLSKVLMLIYFSSCTATDHTGWFPLTCRQSNDQLGGNSRDATTHDEIILSCWVNLHRSPNSHFAHSFDSYILLFIFKFYI